jgi:hypothetical protein
MKSIVKLEWDNELTIRESVEIIDHSNSYEVKFKFKNGYVSTDYIRKDLYNSIPYEENGTWKNIIYINGTKYHKAPMYWINLVKTWRRKKDTRKWLRKE